MTKIVLIDSNSLINRAFYALPVMQNNKGQFTNAVYGFISMLQRLIAEENPTHICAVFDEKEKTFRNEIYEAYKANRKGMPDELGCQLPLLKDVLEAMDIKILSKEGYEADDIIGTLAKRFKQNTIIVTGDKDCLQLVDDTTRVYLTRRGVTDIKEYNLVALSDEGLKPWQIIELKGLAGDASDNIPGARGIGEKTARKLLNEYQSIENIYDNIYNITGKLKDKLLESKDNVYLSRKLATINTNVDIECNIEDIVFKYPLRKKALYKMQELEFKGLSARFLYDEDAAENLPAKQNVQITHIKTVSELMSMTASIPKGSKIVVDFGQTIVVAVCGMEYHISVSDDLFGEGIAVYEAAEHLSQLFSEDYVKVFFDAKKHMHSLEEYSIKIKKPYEDIQLKAYLINPSRTFNTVKELIEIYLPGYEHLCCAMLELNDILDAKMAEFELDGLYYDIELPLIECLYDMEKTGFKIDKDILESISTQYNEEINQLIKKIYNIAGEEFNINSPQQLAHILFDKLGLPTKKKNKTGYSVSAEVLEELDHPIIEHLLRYRILMKIKTTYIDGLRNVMNKVTGRVHTCFKQSNTATGRLSSTEPNLQNIPIRRAEGREIRKMFVASLGCNIVSADYSQIELRLLAHFSGDENLIDAYKHAVDIHAMTASKIYNVPLEEVTEEMRSASKAVNFGIIYGISSFGLSRNLSVSRSEAKKYIDEYFKTYPSVKEFMDMNVKKAQEQGYLKTFKGRIRFFPEFRSPNFATRTFGKRAAMNMPLQGGASDIIKIAMLKVYNALKEGNFKAKLILQVHDELIVDAPEEETEKVKQLLKENMENAVKLSVPLPVNVRAGKNWYEA